RDPREIFANNVQGTINLLEAAKRSGVEKIVCTSTIGILEPGTLDRLATEERLASPSQFKGPYKRSKFRSYLEVKQRADAGWPIVTTLPTAPIGPHDVRPTPTGMIVVAFLNGRIPLLARTGLNFVDVRHCALGHLLSTAPFMMRWKISSRAASRQLLPADSVRREGGDDFFERPVATERIPNWQPL